MKQFNIIYLLVAMAITAIPAHGANPPAEATPQVAPSPSASQEACATKGCPRLDQNGQAPVSCSYTSSMATGWQCILICAYPKTNWGTTRASSFCD